MLNNVTKFHKILIKSMRFREGTSLGQTYVRTYVKYRRMDRGNTLSPGHCHGGGITKLSFLLEQVSVTFDKLCAF